MKTDAFCFGHLEDAPVEVQGGGSLRTVKHVNHRLEEKWGPGKRGNPIREQREGNCEVRHRREGRSRTGRISKVSFKGVLKRKK